MSNTCRPVSLTDGVTGKRLRISHFQPGSAIQVLNRPCPPLPVLGYWHHADGLNVYVPGPMAPELRSAVEENRTQEEVLLLPLTVGIEEIDVTDCRREVRVYQLYPETAVAA